MITAKRAKKRKKKEKKGVRKRGRSLFYEEKGDVAFFMTNTAEVTAAYSILRAARSIGRVRTGMPATSGDASRLKKDTSKVTAIIIV